MYNVIDLMIHPVIGRLKLLLAYIYLGQFQTASDLSARFEAPKQRTDHKALKIGKYFVGKNIEVYECLT